MGKTYAADAKTTDNYRIAYGSEPISQIMWITPAAHIEEDGGKKLLHVFFTVQNNSGQKMTFTKRNIFMNLVDPNDDEKIIEKITIFSNDGALSMVSPGDMVTFHGVKILANEAKIKIILQLFPFAKAKNWVTVEKIFSKTEK